MNLQPYLFADGWYEVKDGNPAALSIFARHYSFRPRKLVGAGKLLLGPGEKMLLVWHDGRAIFGWRKHISDDGQTGVCCAIFRNESVALSSWLIGMADDAAWERWPGESRHYTYVDARRVRSTNPGFCFMSAGWRRCGVTKKRGHLILERERAA